MPIFLICLELQAWCRFAQMRPLFQTWSYPRSSKAYCTHLRGWTWDSRILGCVDPITAAGFYSISTARYQRHHDRSLPVGHGWNVYGSTADSPINLSNNKFLFSTGERLLSKVFCFKQLAMLLITGLIRELTQLVMGAPFFDIAWDWLVELQEISPIDTEIC